MSTDSTADNEPNFFGKVWNKFREMVGNAKDTAVSSKELWDAASPAVNEQNRSVFTKKNEDVLEAIEAFSPEEKQAFNDIAGPLRGFLNAKFATIPEKGAGVDPVAYVIYRHTHDLTDNFGALGAKASNFAQNLGEGSDELANGWKGFQKENKALWADDSKNFFSKVVGTISAFVGNMVGAVKDALTDVASEGSEDLLKDRAEKIRADLAAMGYDEHFTSVINTAVLEQGAKAINNKTGLVLDFDDDVAPEPNQNQQIIQEPPVADNQNNPQQDSAKQLADATISTTALNVEEVDAPNQNQTLPNNAQQETVALNR